MLGLLSSPSWLQLLTVLLQKQSIRLDTENKIQTTQLVDNLSKYSWFEEKNSVGQGKITSLSEEQVVNRPIPWQNSRIDWATFSGASTRTSPTSSSLRMLVLVVSAAWYIVSVVWRKLDWSPTISKESHTKEPFSFSEMSVRFMKESTKYWRFLNRKL